MVKDINSIRGARIVHQQTGQILGLLNLPIVDPDTGVIEAFWVKPTTLPIGDAILLSSNILEFKKKIYIKSEQGLCAPEEVVRVAQILEDGRLFLNSKVENEKGKPNGYVYNFSFSTKTYLIKKLYIQKLFLGFFGYKIRLISQDRIVKVLPGRIVIDDDTTKKATEKTPEKVVEPFIETA